MTPKTPEELKTWCQQVADLTGCVVTADRTCVEIWHYGIDLTSLEYDEFFKFWDLIVYEDTSYTNKSTEIAKVDIVIPDPQNWIFEPGGTT